jgi:transposase
VTRTYKQKLSKAERKEFRARMWEFRRRPAEQTPTQAEALEALFQEVPALRVIHALRWELTAIFDSAGDRSTAEAAIAAWREKATASGLDWDGFLGMYDRHRDGILAYFDYGESSGPVEGLNNKARVILKRSYGLKSCESLWTRLILDVNWVAERIGKTVADMHALANRIWSVFCGYYT